MSSGDIIQMQPLRPTANQVLDAPSPVSHDTPPSPSHPLPKSDEQEYSELKELVEKQEDRVQKIQTSAFQLGSYYFVFQGVVFSAIANATTLTHSDAWFIIIPSMVAAILNFVAVWRISRTYINAKGSLDETRSRWDIVGKRIHDSRAASTVASQDDDEAVGDDTQTNHHEMDKCTPTTRNACMYVCLFLFLVFTGSILLGALIITRGHERRRNDIYKGDCDDHHNCMRHCDGSNSCIFICQTGLH